MKITHVGEDTYLW